MTHRSFMYRDPAEIVERAERYTCKGCIYLARVFGMDVCSRADNRKPGEQLRRCRKYDDGREGDK